MTLDDWLKRNNVTETAFAERIGSSQASVNRYRKGRVPESAIMRRIIIATKGAVTANDFFNVPRKRRAA